jgi:hypothetical protein
MIDPSTWCVPCGDNPFTWRGRRWETMAGLTWDDRWRRNLNRSTQPLGKRRVSLTRAESAAIGGRKRLDCARRQTASACSQSQRAKAGRRFVGDGVATAICNSWVAGVPENRLRQSARFRFLPRVQSNCAFVRPRRGTRCRIEGRRINQQRRATKRSI